MKRIILYSLIMVLGSGLKAQTLDTIQSRCNRYYYSEWYDQCDHYIHPPDYLLYPHHTFHLSTPGFEMDSLQVVYVSDYTTTSLEIKGVAVMLSSYHIPQYVPDGYGNYECNYLHSERLPEYVMLYQMDDKDSGQIQLLDSVRWDTAAVHVLRLPQNELEPDNDSFHLYCHVYEVYFDTPVTVYHRFFLGGTLINNGYDTIQGVLTHHPTGYMYVGDDAHGCDTCHGYYRKFYFSHPDSGMFPDPNKTHLRTKIGGPFLPIVNNPQPQQYVTVTAKANNPFWGDVSGSGTYLLGDSIHLTATPADERYRFQGWDDWVQEPSRIIVPVGDTTVTAYFSPVSAITSPQVRTLDFLIVPNPARDLVTVKTGIEGHYTLTLYNTSGRELLRKEFHGLSCQIDSGHLAAGNYLIVLQSGDLRRAKLFIKQ